MFVAVEELVDVDVRCDNRRQSNGEYSFVDLPALRVVRATGNMIIGARDGAVQTFPLLARVEIAASAKLEIHAYYRNAHITLPALQFVDNNGTFQLLADNTGALDLPILVQLGHRSRGSTTLGGTSGVIRLPSLTELSGDFSVQYSVEMPVLEEVVGPAGATDTSVLDFVVMSAAPPLRAVRRGENGGRVSWTLAKYSDVAADTGVQAATFGALTDVGGLSLLTANYFNVTLPLVTTVPSGAVVLAHENGLVSLPAVTELADVSLRADNYRSRYGSYAILQLQALSTLTLNAGFDVRALDRGTVRLPSLTRVVVNATSGGALRSENDGHSLLAAPLLAQIPATVSVDAGGQYEFAQNVCFLGVEATPTEVKNSSGAAVTIPLCV